MTEQPAPLQCEHILDYYRLWTSRLPAGPKRAEMWGKAGAYITTDA